MSGDLRRSRTGRDNVKCRHAAEFGLPVPIVVVTALGGSSPRDIQTPHHRWSPMTPRACQTRHTRWFA